MYTTWIDPEKLVLDYLFRTGYEGELNEEILFIAINEAADLLLSAQNYAEVVAVLDMYNGKASLPKGFKDPLQVAYRSGMDTQEKINVLNVITENCEFKDKDLTINYDNSTCTKCKKDQCSCDKSAYYPVSVNANYITLASKPKLAASYSKFMYGSTNAYHNSEQTYPKNSVNVNQKLVKRNYPYSYAYKCPTFQLVRPTTNYFFNLPRRVKACNIPSFDTNLEYKIDNGMIEINNIYGSKCNACPSCIGKSEGPCEYNYEVDRSGHILLSYRGRRINKNGMLLIPDEPFVKKAITEYAVQFMAYMKYSKTLEPKHERYYGNAKQLSDRSMRKAQGRLKTPSEDQWDAFIDNVWLKRNLNRSTHQLHNNAALPDNYRLPHQTGNIS